MRSGVAMVCSTLEISSHLSFTAFNISSLIYTFASLDTLCHNKVHVYFVSFIPFHLFRQVFCYNFIEQTWLLASAHPFLQSHWAVGLNSQCCGQLTVSSPHWYLKLLCLQSCSSSLVFCILLVESTGNWSHPGSLWFMKFFCYLCFHLFFFRSSVSLMFSSYCWQFPLYLPILSSTSLKFSSTLLTFFIKLWIESVCTLYIFLLKKLGKSIGMLLKF